MGAGESDGQVNIQIGVINGTLKTSVAVNFFINQSQFVGGKPNIHCYYYNYYCAYFR